MNIGAVERDTGLSKDTLRMWERRYAFPTPGRDHHGERVYSLEDVEKLKFIKQLMKLGHRPGKIIGQSMEQLRQLVNSRAAGVVPAPEMEVFLDLIKSHQLPELRHHLSQTLARQGLQKFILDTVAPLNIAVGNAWMDGEIAVFEEHLYSELIQNILRSSIGSIQPQGRAPRVLLTSLPGEQHGLGLLMAEAMLVVEGAACIALGTETPVSDTVNAAHAHAADVVALSFSASYPEAKAADNLKHLREVLPGKVGLWVGGAAVARIRKQAADVQLVGGLGQIAELVSRWRAQRSAG